MIVNFADDTNKTKSGAWRKGDGRGFGKTRGGASCKKRSEEKSATLGTPEILRASSLDAGQRVHPCAP